MNEKIESLLERLDYRFKNQNLIIEALTHKSCKKKYNNERLEFLGDAVLDLIVGEFLYNQHKKSKEGDLSKIRAALVNEKAFSKLALSLDIGSALNLSESEARNNGREKPSLLSDAFEAVMGAIYLDGGLAPAQRIVNRLLRENYSDFKLESLFEDYKTSLQELTQAHFGVTPTYRVVGTSGPDHLKSFEMELSINKKVYAVAEGKSKKEAQQNCAKITLDILKDELE